LFSTLHPFLLNLYSQDDLLQDTQSLDPFVRDNVEVFSSNWTYVRHSSDRTEEEEEEARKGSRITASKSELEAPSPRAQDKLRTMLEMQRAAKVSGIPTTTIDANFLTRPSELRFNEKVSRLRFPSSSSNLIEIPFQRHELFATIALAQDRTADQVIGRPFIEHM
jgi:hypothetical protein